MRYTIKPSDDGFLNIEMEFLPTRTGIWEILLPSWRPGRYQSQHFAKNIPSLLAFSGITGMRDSKNSFIGMAIIGD
jgi:predicted metalloprotease with PDZ domain